MDLYLIRHADAVRLGEGGGSEDAERPLSPDGVEQARQLGRALRARGVSIGLVLTSPLVRARQTAEEMLSAWGEAKPELRTCEELEPGVKSKRLARFLRDHSDEAVALVGHQPDLSQHAAWLIGSKKAQLDFAKGGIAHILCERTGRGGGVLNWLLTPEWMR
jgi:phosphohistidine phosphatase